LRDIGGILANTNLFLVMPPNSFWNFDVHSY
jgi:hypothetical protein